MRPMAQIGLICVFTLGATRGLGFADEAVGVVTTAKESSNTHDSKGNNRRERSSGLRRLQNKRGHRDLSNHPIIGDG